MFAILSDIHSNIEALSTVLADIERRGIKTIYCLGDVVGYGPNPRECLDLIIQKSEWCVLGNHDYAVFYEPTNFNYGAEQASFWTRDVLETDGDKARSDKRWRFLGDLVMRHSGGIKGVRYFFRRLHFRHSRLDISRILSLLRIDNQTNSGQHKEVNGVTN